MERKNETMMRFGTTFQENLCQLILEDRPFCDQIEEVLDVEFLELRYLQVFAKTIFNYRLKYGTHPTYDITATMLKSDLKAENEAVKKQVRDYFTRIMSGEVKGTEYIKDRSLDFCRKQVLKGAMMKSIGLLKTSSFDEIQKIIDDALKLGTDNNFGHDFLKDFEQRFLVKSRDPISTGWKRIDEICKGGIGKRELGVVIAPTGAGKSMVLCHLGTQALKEGKTVIHYTLELADSVVGTRYDCCLSGVSLRDHKINKEKIFDVVSEVDGHLIIKEYPTKSASTNTIKTHIEKLKKRGIEPDMIIVDYADLLRPVRNTSEKRHDLENIYEELRAIAQVYDCPLWTASQTNRSGLNAEVITMEAISEAFNKCFVADFICSLSRTVEDKNANTGRVFIAKNRNGPDGLVFPAFVDWSNIRIKILERNNGEEGAPVESTKEALDFLKKKYKDMRNK
tara:strand:- start:1889 stop:3244 length:1356 start_codon:yes stop_codon:yes gene_type:complete